MSLSLPPKIEGLIPHQGPMLVVDELVALDGDEAVSRTIFSRDSIFIVQENKLDEAVLFEMMAQTFAAATALKRPRESKLGAKAGFLVGIKKTSFTARPEIGSPVTVKVKIISRVEDFSIVEGEARQNGRLLACGQLTVYVPSGELE